MAVLAQLSDFHLGDDPVAEARFTSVLRHLERMTEPVDGIVVTGDVLDVPGVGDYREIGRRLAGLGRPVLACPGNHDDASAFRALVGLPAGDGPLDTALALDGVTILACDSTVRGEPWGRLGEETLDWLERQLVAAAATPVVVALHHVPVALGLPLVDVIGLRDTRALEAVVRGARSVVGILSGHAHTAAATTFAGVPLFVAPAVSSTLLLETESGIDSHFDRDAPPAFALHVVEDGRLTSHVRVTAPEPPPTR